MCNQACTALTVFAMADDFLDVEFLLELFYQLQHAGHLHGSWCALVHFHQLCGTIEHCEHWDQGGSVPGRKKGGGEGGGKETKAVSHIRNKTPVAVLVPIICYLLFRRLTLVSFPGSTHSGGGEPGNKARVLP